MEILGSVWFHGRFGYAFLPFEIRLTLIFPWRFCNHLINPIVLRKAKIVYNLALLSAIGLVNA